MSSQEFVFKQFTILQDKCAMKVGTDAVLLGSWVTTAGAKKILDIGTGTGIIALMLAQKSAANVDAIDIDNKAFEQASQNAENSKWKDRIHIYHTSLQQFSQEHKQEYDLIVSNPPYFIDSSKALEEARTNARHTDQLPFYDLLNGVLALLNPTGKFYVILPTKESQFFREMAEKQNLFLRKLTRVITRTDKPEKRVLMKFKFAPGKLEEDSIVIEKDGRHIYTDEYIELTKDYYLGF
jgi:tRNA1Val (adenine37-N6)-methyltransferase